MSQPQDAATEMMSQWLKLQESFMKDWMEAMGKMTPPMTPPAEWPKMPFNLGSLYDAWYRSLGEMFKEEEEEGLGQLVHGRITTASKLYLDLLNFWSKTGSIFKALPPDKPPGLEQINEFREKWMKDYRTLMEALWGELPATEDTDLEKTFARTAAAGPQYAMGFFEPFMKNLSRMPEIFQKISKGDISAISDLGGIFSKNYEDVVGRAMLAPSVSYFKELQRKINQTIHAFIQFNTAKNAFYSLLYKTGLKAADKVYQKSLAFAGKEASPESFKEFYRLWLTTNEEVYHEFLKSDEFGNMVKEMVTRGLRFRKWVDDLTDHALKFTNIPGKKDMDEIYKSIHDLRSEVRAQRRNIKALEKKLAAKARRKTSSE
jgi:class III poly(R)-hydroxyalkanoic acid synthase PhaE subunit